jgi:hypothetical protein
MKKLALIVLAFALLVSCKKNDTNDSSSQPFVSYFSDTSSNKVTGGKPATGDELQNISFAEDIDTSLLPKLKSVNTLPPSWSINVPPPGKQGDIKSCVGWTVAYGMLGYEFNKIDGNSNYNGLDKIFAPMYVYNQLNGGYNSPISIPAALNLIEDQGCCKASDMSQNLNDFTTQPTATARNHAASYKLLEWHYFRQDEFSWIKTFVTIHPLQI